MHKHRGLFRISMGQHKFSGSGVEAHIQHGCQGEQTSHREHQIQRKYITENAVDHRRQRGAADGGRIDESEDRAPVLLRQGQHQGSVENRIAGTVRKGSEKGHDAQGNKFRGEVGQGEEQHGAGEAQGHDPKARLRAQLHNAESQHTDQRCGGPDCHQISVHVHGKALLHAKGKHQRQRSCGQQIQNQGGGHKDPQTPVGKNRPDRFPGIMKDAFDRHRLTLLDGPGDMDEQLGRGTVQIAQTVDDHDQRHTEEGDHHAAEGRTHHADQGIGAGKDGLSPDHIIVGNDVDHQRSGGGRIEHTAQGGQERGDQHTGDAQPVQIGQQTDDEHHDTLHDVHPHQHPFAAAFIHNAAAEGGQKHGHEHGNGGHDAHQGTGTRLPVDPVADGHAVHQITDGADDISL